MVGETDVQVKEGFNAILIHSFDVEYTEGVDAATIAENLARSKRQSKSLVTVQPVKFSVEDKFVLLDKPLWWHGNSEQRLPYRQLDDIFVFENDTKLFAFNISSKSAKRRRVLVFQVKNKRRRSFVVELIRKQKLQYEMYVENNLRNVEYKHFGASSLKDTNAATRRGTVDTVISQLSWSSQTLTSISSDTPATSPIPRTHYSRNLNNLQRTSYTEARERPKHRRGFSPDYLTRPHSAFPRYDGHSHTQMEEEGTQMDLWTDGLALRSVKMTQTPTGLNFMRVKRNSLPRSSFIELTKNSRAQQTQSLARIDLSSLDLPYQADKRTQTPILREPETSKSLTTVSLVQAMSPQQRIMRTNGEAAGSAYLLDKSIEFCELKPRNLAKIKPNGSHYCYVIQKNHGSYYHRM
ncbi:unnamed protein product [Calicophoron daubneyi]|uniref:Uncharacterized protein n=1 Tax=Calicophoron daubneyi TaxID=300641 RepID=A0AAV2TKN5_CALDB